MLPIVWDGTQEGLPAGWDAALSQVAQEHVEGRSPTALLAVSVTVDLQYQGQGISSIAYQAGRENTHGCATLDDGKRHHCRMGGVGRDALSSVWSIRCAWCPSSSDSQL